MIYAFSNPCMPGILKVGMTKRNIESRLKEANGSDTWRPPLLYKVELAKYVTNYKQKEKDIHALFSHLGKRIHPRKEFFETSLDEVKLIFNLIDGEEFIPKTYNTSNIKSIENISPIEEWKKTTNLSDYLCKNAYIQFIQWLQRNIPGIDKSYSYYKYIKLIS